MPRYNVMTETFQETAILGKPALFTSIRIDRNTVPHGYHLYEVRHDDDCRGDVVQIACNIAVNHWGSLITRDEIDLPFDGYLDIEPDDLNYSTGDCRSMVRFMAKYPPIERRYMNHNTIPFNGYESGGEFWRDKAVCYGIDEAIIICGNYIGLNLKREHSDDERQFCRGIFAAAYEATADRIDPAKLVYPYEFAIANDRGETPYFHKNREMNQKCARAIDTAISESCYKAFHYNLELAAMSVIGGHGFQRVNAVLAHQIQKNEYDGRYSQTNKSWAKHFRLSDKAFGFLDSHATLIEGFTNYARKLYAELGAQRFALPGQEEQGEVNQGFTIMRSIMVDANQGYVIAHNPDAYDSYVCWQFYIRDGKRHYNWGVYGDVQAAVNGYNARLFVAFN